MFTEKGIHSLDTIFTVLGGDLVVHRTATGAWDGASATFREPLALDLRPVVSATAATATAHRAASAITGLLAVGSPGLVIDAVGTVKGTAKGKAPALAWDVVTSGTQADGTPSLELGIAALLAVSGFHGVGVKLDAARRMLAGATGHA